MKEFELLLAAIEERGYEYTTGIQRRSRSEIESIFQQHGRKLPSSYLELISKYDGVNIKIEQCDRGLQGVGLEFCFENLDLSLVGYEAAEGGDTRSDYDPLGIFSDQCGDILALDLSTDSDHLCQDDVYCLLPDPKVAYDSLELALKTFRIAIEQGMVLEPHFSDFYDAAERERYIDLASRLNPNSRPYWRLRLHRLRTEGF